MNKENLPIIKELMEIVKDDVVSKRDLNDFIKSILKYVADQKREVAELSEYTAIEIKEAVAYFEDEKEKLLGEITKIAETKKNDAVQEISTIETDIQGKVNTINSLLKKIESIKVTPAKDGYTPKKGIDYFDGEPGADAVFNSEELIAQVLEKIPKVEEPEMVGEDIIVAINELPVDDDSLKIDAKHIKNLPKERIYGSRNGSGGGTWGTITGTLSDQTDLQTELDTKVTLTGTETLTNKRITPRVVTVTNATTFRPNTDNADVSYQANTQATGTLTVLADLGTPTNGQMWIMKLKSTNVQTFSWDSSFIGGSGAYAVTLPTASTGGGKIDYFGFIYDTENSRWQLLAVSSGY